MPRIPTLAIAGARFVFAFYGVTLACLAVVVAVMFVLGAITAAAEDQILFQAMPVLGESASRSNKETDAKPIEQRGRASWYGDPQRIACGGKGARFDPEALTAAHLKVHEWGCGTRVLVTNTRNGKSVEVVLFDHGPADWTGNIIDLSRAAFREIEDLKRGFASVTITILELKPPAPRRNRKKV